MLKKERLLIIGLAAAFAIIFGFLAMFTPSLYYVLSAIITVVILIFAMIAVYIRTVHQRAIKEMTHELIYLSNNLEERDYSHYPEETQGFYHSLSQVKQVLAKREQSRKEIMDIYHYIALNSELDKILKEIVPRVANLTKSQCCAFYSVTSVKKLTLRYSVGFGKNIYSEFDIAVGEGFIGHLALKDNITVVYEVPDDTIYMVRTFLGKIKPRSMMIVPIFHEQALSGVVVCASVNTYTDEDVANIDLIKYCLSIAMVNGINAEKNKKLTNESEFQNSLIQNQHKEMQDSLRDKELIIYHLASILSKEISFMLDAEYRVLSWNKDAIEVYGISKEEACGRKIDNIHQQLGWDPIENIIKSSVSMGGLEYNLNSIKMQFTKLAEDKSLGIIVKIKR